VKCRAAWAGAVLSAVLLLTGCGGGLSADGEALTLDQSEALAQVRFRLAAQGDGVIELTAGDADAVDHVAGTLTLDFDDGVAWGELARGPEGIAVTEQVAFTPDLYLVRTAGGWQRTTAPSPMLRVVFGLGSDRPENAQLLRQSDARYLGTAEDAGRTLQVFRAPSADGAPARTRLWVDDDGALRRLDAGDDRTLVIRPVDEEPAARIPILDELIGPADG